MKFLAFLTLFIFAACSSPTPMSSGENDELHIWEVTPNKWTAFTKQNLYQLHSIYDLSPFLFSKKIYIESKVSPKPFPKLTLNTRYAEEPKKLLSELLHEELYWWEKDQKALFEQAQIELAKSYPKLSNKNLGLLLICYLELEAMEHFLGKKEAHVIIRSKVEKDKAYPWFYGQVLSRSTLFKKIISDYALSPLANFKSQ